MARSEGVPEALSRTPIDERLAKPHAGFNPVGRYAVEPKGTSRSTYGLGQSARTGGPMPAIGRQHDEGRGGAAVCSCGGIVDPLIAQQIDGMTP